MPNAETKTLASWLRLWREELALADSGELPEPLPYDSPVPSSPLQVKPFDDFGVTPRDIRLLNPWLVREVSRPLYFAVLGEWLDGLWLVAPFARFSLPATVGELNIGRGDIDPRQTPLSVLSLWNAHTVPPKVVQQSWFIDLLAETEFENAWSVFRHAMTGKELSTDLLQLVGPPIYHPADPRHDYLTQEAHNLRSLGILAQEYVAGLKLQTAEVPALIEPDSPEFDIEGAFPANNLELAGAAATSGALTHRWRVPELKVIVTFRQSPRGESVVARVTGLQDSAVSYELDGGMIMKGRNVIGKFVHGRGQFQASALLGKLTLRDRSGKPLKVERE